MRRNTLISILFLVFFYCELGWCTDPLQDIEKLTASRSKVELVQPRKAQVLLADYELIRKDFPEETGALKDVEIDKWLLHHGGFLSRTQLAGVDEVNTDIPHEKVDGHGYRPEGYGRGLVFQTKTGLLDGKGFGADKPTQASHKNGLATTAEMIREFGFEKLVHGAFEHYKANFNKDSQFDTVRSYAVIDWGFDVIHNDKTRSPAGAILRQAHNRTPQIDGNSFLPGQVASKVERLLRMYGITSAADPAFYKKHYENHSFDFADLQGTPQGHLVDFGTFRVREKFDKDISFLGDTELDYDIPKNSGPFVQPLEDIRVPNAVWGYEGDGGRGDALTRKALLLAKSFQKGQIPKEEIRRELDTLLKPVIERWSKDVSKSTVQAMKVLVRPEVKNNSNAAAELDMPCIKRQEPIVRVDRISAVFGPVDSSGSPKSVPRRVKKPLQIEGPPRLLRIEGPPQPLLLTYPHYPNEAEIGADFGK